MLAEMETPRSDSAMQRDDYQTIFGGPALRERSPMHRATLPG